MPNIRTLDVDHVMELGAPRDVQLGMEGNELVIYLSGYLTALELETALSVVVNAREKMRELERKAQEQTNHTTIRNMDQCGADDGLSQEELDILFDAEAQGLMVQVLCEACEGYYDIKVGETIINAVSWLHLEGYNKPA